MRPFPSGPILLFLAALGLGACGSAEKRAEAHYQRALALVAAGDTTRAALEFRDVFRLNGGHAGAHLAYADMLRGIGAPKEALRQYLLVADLAPRSIAAPRAAAELALRADDLTTAGEAAAAALRIDPADPVARGVKATLDFRQPGTRAAAVEMARDVLVVAPGNVPAHMVVIADRVNAGDGPGAMARLDIALAAAPEDQGLHLLRLALLEQAGETAAAGAELRTMAGLFPDNAAIRLSLARWLIRAGDLDGAESVLRAARTRAPADPEAAHTLVLFLIDQRGPEAAIAEIDRLVAAGSGAEAATGGAAGGIDPRPFQRLRAGLVFTRGDHDQAIAALRGMITDAPPSDETRATEVALAGMLTETGAGPEARRLIDAVLAEDRSLPAALKLRARLAIGEGAPDQAIMDLRAAQAQAPDDPEIMTLMALAYDRSGSTGLAGERLARAVELARQAPAESLLYARFLIRENRIGPAESVIVTARRTAPEDPDLLEMLGRIHLARADWTRAGQVAALLRATGAPDAAARATALEIASLRRQGRTGEMIALLEDLAAAPDPTVDSAVNPAAGGGDPGSAALVALVRARLAAGETDAARADLAAALERDPADPAARLMLAEVARLDGNAAEAERLYRAVTEDQPALPRAWLGLADLLRAGGRADAAGAALEAGLAATDGAPLLLVAKAGALETGGDAEGAIAIYEMLYAQDGDENGAKNGDGSAAAVIANNLASLLSTARTDPGSLARAHAIARRFETSDTPAFQDTYGWILFRQGDAPAALDRLVAAAEALPGDARTQFHRAEAEFALGRRAEARESYARALAAAADAGSPLPEAETARARIATLDAAPETPPVAPGSVPAAAGRDG